MRADTEASHPLASKEHMKIILLSSHKKTMTLLQESRSTSQAPFVVITPQAYFIQS